MGHGIGKSKIYFSKYSSILVIQNLIIYMLSIIFVDYWRVILFQLPAWLQLRPQYKKHPSVIDFQVYPIWAIHRFVSEFRYTSLMPDILGPEKQHPVKAHSTENKAAIHSRPILYAASFIRFLRSAPIARHVAHQLFCYHDNVRIASSEICFSP